MTKATSPQLNETPRDLKRLELATYIAIMIKDAKAEGSANESLTLPFDDWERIVSALREHTHVARLVSITGKLMALCDFDNNAQLDLYCEARDAIAAADDARQARQGE